MKRVVAVVAEPATGSRQEKKSKAAQPGKRPGALTIGSGPPLAKPKPSPTQGEKRTAGHFARRSSDGSWSSNETEEGFQDTDKASGLGYIRTERTDDQ